MRGLVASLRGRLMLMMLAAALPGFAVIVYSALALRDGASANHGERLIHVAQTLAAEGHSHVEDSRLLLAQLARIPAARAGRGAACHEMLAGIKRLAPVHVANLVVIQPDGEILCSAEAPATRVNVADMPWFGAALGADGFRIGDYHLNRRLGVPVQVMTYTVHAAGRPAVVLAAALDLSWLGSAAEHMRDLPAGSGYGVVDALGTIIASRFPDAGLGAGIALADTPLWSTLAARQGVGTVAGTDRDEHRWLFAYAPVGPAAAPYAWVVAGTPAAAVDAEAHRLLVGGLIGLAVASLLGLAVGWVGGDALLLRPLRPVLDTVRRVAAGELGSRTGVAAGGDEIARIAAEVDAMAQALEQRDAAQRETETRLRQAKAEARSYLDIAGVMIVVLDARGQVVLANRKTCAVLECPTENCCVGGNWFERYIPPEDRATVEALFGRMMAGETEDAEYYENSILTVSGERRLVAWHNALLRDESGAIVGTLSAGEDITAERRLQDDNKRLQAQLLLAQKMEALGQLAGGVAHDFNNILASILGFSKLALQRHVPDKQGPLAEYLREVVAASERARDLVAKMLAFSRSRPAGPAASIATLPVAQEAMRMLAATIPASIRIETRFGAGIPNIAMDPVDFHQVLINLVVNARDAMDGKGTLGITLVRAHLDATVCSSCGRTIAGEFLELAVSDTGCGMAPEVLPRIFDPFFTTKEVGKGTGMGLAVVHGLVLRVGGHFRVETEPWRGTNFRIFLPLAAAVPAAASVPAPIPAPVPAAAAKGRILVVDDDAAILRLLDAALTAAGWEVAVFDDPRAALACFRAAPAGFAAVVTDETMPEITGVELIAVLRKLRPQLPVILCTGYSDGIDAATARSVGAARFFHKPVDPDVLLAALAELTAA